MKPGGGGIGGGRRLGRLDAANNCFVSSDLLESKDWSVVLSISAFSSSWAVLLFELCDSADRESAPSPESSYVLFSY